MGDNNIPNIPSIESEFESELESLRKRCAELEATLANERGLGPAPEGWSWDTSPGEGWIRTGTDGQVWRYSDDLFWHYCNGPEYSRKQGDTARAAMFAADVEWNASKAVT